MPSALYHQFIVEELLLKYFCECPASEGDRFYLVIEDDDERRAFRDALYRAGKPIVLKNIYQGGGLSLQEDYYETIALYPSGAQNLPGIIIAFDEYAPMKSEAATEDYLTTIRNAVGGKGSDYEHFCVLCILKKTGLSSIDSSFTDLQLRGMPLNSNSVCDAILKKLETNQCFSSKIECSYLKVHIDNIRSYIEDGIYSLFDFRHVLSVLETKQLFDHYPELEFFPDAVSDIHFSTENQRKQRAEENHETFCSVRDAMHLEEREERFTALSKILDKKLSEKLSRFEDEEWKETSYQDICSSIDSLAQEAKLVFDSVELRKPFGASTLLKYTKGKVNKNSDTYLLVCEPDKAEERQLVFSFNQGVADQIEKKDEGLLLSVRGTKITATVNSTPKLQTFTVGHDNNQHSFYIYRVPCLPHFFDSIEHGFKLTKKGVLQYTVPQGKEEVVLGEGAEEVRIQPDDKVICVPNTTYRIRTTNDGRGSTRISFTLCFGVMELEVHLSLEGQSAPPARPKTLESGKNYKLSPTADDPFGAIIDEDGGIRPTWKPWRRYLQYEDVMVRERAHCLKVSPDGVISAHRLELPETVEVAYDAIVDYYAAAGSLPSIHTYESEELRALYKKFAESVVAAVAEIPSGEQMERAYYHLTQLGAVCEESRICFSPFHPLLIAYQEELRQHCAVAEEKSSAADLLSPFYSIPFLYQGEEEMSPCTDSEFQQIPQWLAYQSVSCRHQQKNNRITDKLVRNRINDFTKHFPYLFQQKDRPIIINVIGIEDDTCIVRGLIRYIVDNFECGCQHIEWHSYVDNLMQESYFERLNRLNSFDAIFRDLEDNDICIPSDPRFTPQDIIRSLFFVTAFYKHKLNKDSEMNHCHIAFYQMDSGIRFSLPNTDKLRSEQVLSGLVSMPSTLCDDSKYYIGYGTRHARTEQGVLPPMVRALNNLYANAKAEGSNAYNPDICLAKRYEFRDHKLLQSIYENSNWVTFLYPEVDLGFFYGQPELNIVHYTDQYDLNAKYDSITVTHRSHLGQYINSLKHVFSCYSHDDAGLDVFVRTLMPYLNCLNGNWLLRIVNEPSFKAREKMSLVATSFVMKQLLARVPNVVWVPLSLEDILRVTGSIGLEMHHLFSKKAIGATGPMSDDLLMMGLTSDEAGIPRLLMYPVEVKYSENSVNDLAAKGCKQVAATFRILDEHLCQNESFDSLVYRTFFASLFLTVAEKLHAHKLITDEDAQLMELCRYDLLNNNCDVCMGLPDQDLGKAAVVSYYEKAPSQLQTTEVDGVAVCCLTLDTGCCVESLTNMSPSLTEFLRHGEVIVSCEAADMEPINPTPALSRTDGADEQTPVESVTVGADKRRQEGGEGANSAETHAANTMPEASAVAVAPPFSIATSEGVSTSPIRVQVGHTMSSGMPIFFEPGNTHMVSHPNMGIIGTMGTGKTQFARSFIAQLSKESAHNVGGTPVGVLVFDYKGDYKDAPFLAATGGEAYKFNFPFNPLKLVLSDDVAGMNLPAITADRISDSFAKAYGLGLKQQSLIKQIIIATYEDAGITRRPDTWTKPVPTMAQVIEKYFSEYDANDKSYALFDKLRDYTIFAENNDDCVSLFEWLDRVRVIDLTLYPDDTKKVIVSLILDLFYAEMRQLGASRQEQGCRELRAMIMVDEAHQFLKKDFMSLRNIISEGRMFGVGMILSTQNIGDFKSAKEDYSQFILSWVIHHVNSISRSELACIFSVNDPHLDTYMTLINKAGLFESVCKIGNRVESMKDFPFFRLVEEDSRFQQSV